MPPSVPRCDMYAPPPPFRLPQFDALTRVASTFKDPPCSCMAYNEPSFHIVLCDLTRSAWARTLFAHNRSGRGHTARCSLKKQIHGISNKSASHYYYAPSRVLIYESRPILLPLSRVSRTRSSRSSSSFFFIIIYISIYIYNYYYYTIYYILLLLLLIKLLLLLLLVVIIHPYYYSKKKKKKLSSFTSFTEVYLAPPNKYINIYK